MTFNQGSIVLVPFPFTDLSSSKKRPVLILSKDQDNNKNDDVVTCAITSKQRVGAYNLKIDNEKLREGQLPVTSTILISKLFTIEKNLIIRQFAKVDDTTLQEVKELFQKIV